MIETESIPINGFNNKYFIHRDGYVISYKLNKNGKILKSQPNSFGYHRVALVDEKKNSKTYFIHNLVTYYFIGIKDKGIQVRHLDGNKNNNKLSNLKYGTPKENAQDKLLHGTKCDGEKNGNHILTDEQVNEIRIKYKGFGFAKELAEEYNVSESLIGLIIKNKSRKIKSEKHIDLINNNYSRGMKILSFTKDGLFNKSFNSISDGARFYNILPSSIVNNLKGKSKTCNNLIWKYNE